MKERLLNFFKKRYIIVAFTVFFTFFITRQVYYLTPIKEAVEIIKKYENNKFHLKYLPDGIVTSIIGVTTTYDSLLIALPPPSRFHKFEVTIINPKTYTVHLVIVPQYAITAFQLGMPVLNGNEEQFQIPQQPQPQFKKRNDFNYEKIERTNN